MDSHAALDLKSGPRVIELWAGLLVGPMAVLIQLQTNYALVLWACSHSRTWALHLVSLIVLLLTTVVGLISYRNWRQLVPQGDEDDPGPISRGRFMAIIGTLISCLMILVSIAQWLPVFIYGPCER